MALYSDQFKGTGYRYTNEYRPVLNSLPIDLSRKALADTYDALDHGHGSVVLTERVDEERCKQLGLVCLEEIEYA